MTEQQLRQYKEVYKKITVPDAVVERSWESLSNRLPERQHSFISQLSTRNSQFKFPMVFAALVLFLTAGTVGVAQAARPGDLLYPVKVFSDVVVAKVTGKPQIMIEKRSNELIEESKKNEAEKSSERVEKAAEEYEKALEETKKDVKGANSNHQEVQNTIASQTGKLKQIKTVNPHVEQILDKAIENTEKTKEVIKGQDNPGQEKKEVPQTERNSGQENSGNNNNSNSNNNAPQTPPGKEKK